MTKTEAPTALAAVLNHIHDVATIAGQLESIANAIPKAAYETEGMVAGRDLAAMVEGGVPDVLHGLEDHLEALGHPRDGHQYWRQYCRGYQCMELLRANAPSEAFKQDPEEWMKARMEAARGA